MKSYLRFKRQNLAYSSHVSCGIIFNACIQTLQRSTPIIIKTKTGIEWHREKKAHGGNQLCHGAHVLISNMMTVGERGPHPPAAAPSLPNHRLEARTKPNCRRKKSGLQASKIVWQGCEQKKTFHPCSQLFYWSSALKTHCGVTL